ncbi:MAG: hypothetical protein ACYTXC_27725 [Nostoc sp.]
MPPLRFPTGQASVVVNKLMHLCANLETVAILAGVVKMCDVQIPDNFREVGDLIFHE